MSESEKSYLPFIVITGIIFAFIIVMSIIVSQSFGTMALSDAAAITGIQENQTFETMNTTQQASYFMASSLVKLPPGSEISLAVSIILAIVIGFLLIRYAARLFKGLLLRIIYFISIWSLIIMFQTAIGYLVIGSKVFSPFYIILVFLLSTALMLVWLIYPEWWIVDTIAIIIAITGSAFLGSSFPPIVIIVLLAALSVYDYIAVVKTNFMMKLAKGVMSAQLPAALIIPYDKNASLLKDGVNFEPVSDRFERRFMVLGTGDLLFPTLLAVSSSIYVSIISGLIIGLFIIISYFIMVWFMVYSKYADKIQALPGLPFLCSGAIIGYALTLII